MPAPAWSRPRFLVSHAYEKAGTYVVKAYDSGDRSQAPLTVEVRVAADPRRVRVEPERPAAGAELEFSVVNFNTPDRLRWDMGDGTLIPGKKERGVMVGSPVNYRYARPGTTRSTYMTGEGTPTAAGPTRDRGRRCRPGCRRPAQPGPASRK